MSLCDSCKYQYYVEQLKPCIIYRDDCEFYEADDFHEEPKTGRCKDCKYCGEVLKDNLHSCNNDKSIFKTCLETATSCEKFEPKTGRCKDCKWWKDSDGVFRRGIGAESQCPINTLVVQEGDGYCYMFEPQERKDKE